VRTITWVCTQDFFDTRGAVCDFQDKRKGGKMREEAREREAFCII